MPKYVNYENGPVTSYPKLKYMYMWNITNNLCATFSLLKYQIWHADLEFACQFCFLITCCVLVEAVISFPVNGCDVSRNGLR